MVLKIISFDYLVFNIVAENINKQINGIIILKLNFISIPIPKTRSFYLYQYLNKNKKIKKINIVFPGQGLNPCFFTGRGLNPFPIDPLKPIHKNIHKNIFYLVYTQNKHKLLGQTYQKDICRHTRHIFRDESRHPRPPPNLVDQRSSIDLVSQAIGSF